MEVLPTLDGRCSPPVFSSFNSSSLCVLDVCQDNRCRKVKNWGGPNEITFIHSMIISRIFFILSRITMVTGFLVKLMEGLGAHWSVNEKKDFGY